jgi:uncharacterized tellurite resistance protein B-like protein
MSTDLKSFFDIYIRPTEGSRFDRESYEFRYATVALMIACMKSDFDEDPEEASVIIDILRKTFDINESTIEQLMQMADASTDVDNLVDFTDLVNESYAEQDKRFLVENLWRVAFADGRIDKYEEQFIRRVAALIKMTDEDIGQARELATKPL